VVAEANTVFVCVRSHRPGDGEGGGMMRGRRARIGAGLADSSVAAFRGVNFWRAGVGSWTMARISYREIAPGFGIWTSAMAMWTLPDAPRMVLDVQYVTRLDK